MSVVDAYLTVENKNKIKNMIKERKMKHEREEN